MRNLFTCLFLFLTTFVQAENQPVTFVPNKGQWEDGVLYRVQIPGGQMDLRRDGMDYVFYDTDYFRKLHDQQLNADAPLRLHGVRVYFEGSNTSPALQHDLSDGISRNYFLGNNQSRWATGVTGFGEVIYKELYPGIDLRLYAHQATIKYEFIVHSGANPEVIKMRYEGSEQMSISEHGNLEVKTSVGWFRELNPYNYQEIGGKTKEVKGHFSIQNKNTVGFRLPNGYDPKHPLVIDPELIFATFSGSYADNWGHTATYDAEGNLISGGSANASGFPVTAGAYQINYRGNNSGTLWDVAILKYNPTGTRLLYATYLGGTQTDVPHSLIVNSKGELLIFGTTSSQNFPTHEKAYKRTFTGGKALAGAEAPLSGMDYNFGSDIFVAKLSADGKSLLGATYYGTTANDGLNLNTVLDIRYYGDAYRGEIVTDDQDNIIIATTTPSELPLIRPDRLAATVLKFSADLSTLVWEKPRLMGGFSGAYGIRSATSGTIYVCGAVRDNLQTPEDGWIIKLDRSGNVLKTKRVGTNNADVAMLLDIDKNENVYILGLSDGGQYPVTSGTYSNRSSGQFIHAFDPTLDRTLFSTVIGSGRGRPDLAPTAFLVNECGNIYVAGWGGAINHTLDTPIAIASSTRGLPITNDAFQKATDGNNFYLALLESGAKSLLYATYFGNTTVSARIRGDHVDGGTSRFDKRGYVYQAVCSCQPSSFPTTPGAWSSTNRSNNCNNAVFKFDIDNLDVKFDIMLDGKKQDTVNACAPLKLQFVNTSTGGKNYEWTIGNLDRSTNPLMTEYNFTKPGIYVISLVGRNPLSCKKEAVYQRTIRISEPAFQISKDTTMCLGGTARLSVTGGTNYQWNADPSLSSTTQANPSVSPSQTTTYTVKATDAQGCRGEKSVTVTIQPLPVTVQVSEPTICKGQTVQINASGGSSYQWSGDGVTNVTQPNIKVTPTQTTVYTVTVRDSKGCRGQATATVTIDESFRPDFTVDRIFDCTRPTQVRINLANSGGEQYSWNMGNGDSLSVQKPDPYTYLHPGTYQITGSAKRGSCTLSAATPVTIDPPLDVPNVITPNGDGKNDRFVIGTNGLKLDVYNRWGKAVFQQVSYQNDWSPSLAAGTYYYLITFPDGKQCKSWVQIVN
ncbi:gliding motility-associated C-terminal domain-containing protein [Siphonobacter sp. SORGH_AS_1065]|uniref:gliding motility-associated C-terminal domain-containing protein n=1 Tax=Siphonobacter sp. SORGH_AS_1065 TaxID=3041795 RepID=UPI00277E8F00|nr:gliding motility-associated C-terminal domain-containing protein [Siphonobacter sp. SORGH_AS_1065]MDQ1087594.1 gliding motility-associated-like protein [Siphonobacter sp. SORGH_AS_1065]